MKKLFLAVALVMGLGTSVAFANNMVSDVEIATMINEFKPIDVKELPQAVQDAIKENYSEATIKEAAVEVAEDGTKTYKVTLVDASGTENPVLFNEKGEVLRVIYPLAPYLRILWRRVLSIGRHKSWYCCGYNLNNVHIHGT